MKKIQVTIRLKNFLEVFSPYLIEHKFIINISGAAFVFVSAHEYLSLRFIVAAK